MSPQNTLIGDKIKNLLSTLPEDLARIIVFSGISLNPTKLDEAIQTAVALNVMRLYEAEKETMAESLVATSMEKFQEKLDESKKVAKPRTRAKAKAKTNP